MTKEERKVIDAVLDGFYNLFWEYGDKEACFKEDAEMFMVLAMRNV